MKRFIPFPLLILAMLFFQCKAISQTENPYEAMPITDIDGNVYKVIMVEQGIWIAENLRTTKFNDGTPIPLVKDKGAWQGMKTPGYGYYKNDANYIEIYGAIYNWYAIDTKKLCPKGWHVPTYEEWNDLMNYAGSHEPSDDNPSKLKEAGTTHWKSPNNGATNKIFFTALPAGEVSLSNTDAEPGTKTNWWTATEDSSVMETGSKNPPANAMIVGLIYDFESNSIGSFYKDSGLPVRCKMDE